MKVLVAVVLATIIVATISITAITIRIAPQKLNEYSGDDPWLETIRAAGFKVLIDNDNCIYIQYPPPYQFLVPWKPRYA